MVTPDSATGGTTQASHENKTLRRSIGTVSIQPSSDNSPAFGWHGLLKVRQDQTADLPDVNIDAGYDWIFRAYWEARTTSGNDRSQDFRTGFDLHALRKMRLGDDILYIIKVDAGSSGTGISWSAAWRLLFM